MMSRRVGRSIGALMLVPLLLLGGAPQDAASTHTVQGRPITSIRWTFDGKPARPRPFEPSRWSITVNIDATDQFFSRIKPMRAMHGSHCEGPPSTHWISSYDDAVFTCNDHIMTAINGPGYGAVYITPNRMIDFDGRTAVLRFDMSTLRMSDRDWVDLWITPYRDLLQLPLELGGLNPPAYSGPPKRAVHIVMRGSGRGTAFQANVFTNFGRRTYARTSRGYETVLRPDAARRDTFELRISRSHIAFGMPKRKLWWVNNKIPRLAWTRGVVQLAHHSYDPTKDGAGVPATWHWDNLSISRSVGFTIIDGNRDDVSARTPKVVFDRRAPGSACLRFVGIGRPIDVRFNGGRWRRAALQGTLTSQLQFNEFGSFMMPVPKGTRAVIFRGTRWAGRGWRVKDVSIFARGGRC
jgi:hypothetical protein